MNINQAKEAIKAIIELNKGIIENGGTASSMIVPYLSSVPGIGKSSVVTQAAEELEMDSRTVMFAQFDVAELSGFPYLTVENGEQQYKRARPFFMSFDENKGGILFLDELPQALTASQNVAAQLINDRVLGEYKLPDNWFVVAAGNPMSSKAGTNHMPSHLKDRLTSIEVEPDIDSFMEYALQHGLHYNIQGFLRHRPEFLSDFNPQAEASPSPRSWMRVNSLLNIKGSKVVRDKLIAGQVGTAAMADFLGYLQVAEDMPDPKAILDGSCTDVPTDPMIMYALCAALTHYTTTKNVKTLVKYLSSLTDKEYAAFTIQDLSLRDPKFGKNTHIRDWYMSEGRALLSRRG